MHVGLDQRFLLVVKLVICGVEAVRGRGIGGYADRLFGHIGGHCIFGGLVVVGKGNEGSRNPKHSCRGYLAMRILLAPTYQLRRVHRYQTVFLLHCINVLNQTLSDQLVESGCGGEVGRSYQSVVGLYYEKGTHQPAFVGVEVNFSVFRVVVDRYLVVDSALPSGSSDFAEEGEVVLS